MQVFYLIAIITCIFFVASEIFLAAWLYKTTRNTFLIHEALFKRNKGSIRQMTLWQARVFYINSYLKNIVVFLFFLAIVKKYLFLI